MTRKTAERERMNKKIKEKKLRGELEKGVYSLANGLRVKWTERLAVFW